MSNIEINRSMFLEPRLCPVSAWVGHIPFAGWLVEAAKPNLLVELGTHLGASFFTLCQAVQENGLPTRCYAVDTWEGDEHAGHYDEGVYETVVKNQRKFYGEFSKLMRMTFDEAVGYFDDGSIDLLHIDGLHTYAAVRHDFETWLPKLSPRGVVLFHDTCVRERDFGVWKLWEELRCEYPGFEFTHTHGLGVLLVGAKVSTSLRVLANCADAEAARTNTLFARLGELISAKDELAEYAQREHHLKGENGHLRGVIAERDATVGKEQQTLEALRAELERSARDGAEAKEMLARFREAHDILDGQNRMFSAVVEQLSEVGARQKEFAAHAAEIANTWAHRLADLESGIQARIDCLDERLTEANETISHQRVELAALRAEHAMAREQLSKTLRSLSWRVTAPFRALAGAAWRK